MKITGAEHSRAIVDKALFSGDKIVLNGVTKPSDRYHLGVFSERFKEMIDLLKKYPKLTAELISNQDYTCFGEALDRFQG